VVAAIVLSRPTDFCPARDAARRINKSDSIYQRGGIDMSRESSYIQPGSFEQGLTCVPFKLCLM